MMWHNYCHVRARFKCQGDDGAIGYAGSAGEWRPPERQDHLKTLAALSGEAWAGGVVFYGGDTPLPFGPGLQARPIASLWTGERQAEARTKSPGKRLAN